MEDAVLTCCPLLAVEDQQTYWLFGVFDGHGGDFSSKFAAKNFPSILLSALGRPSPLPASNSLEQILHDSCIAVDALLSEEERMKVTAKQQSSDGNVKLSLRDTSGTTSCLCLLTLDDIFLANIGDSRAVLARTSRVSVVTSIAAIPLSIDQKLSLPEEHNRAAQAGCM